MPIQLENFTPDDYVNMMHDHAHAAAAQAFLENLERRRWQWRFLAVLATLTAIAYSGIIVQYLWHWFVAPLEIRELSYYDAVGLNLLITVLVMRLPEIGGDNSPNVPGGAAWMHCARTVGLLLRASMAFALAALVAWLGGRL